MRSSWPTMVLAVVAACGGGAGGRGTLGDSGGGGAAALAEVLARDVGGGYPVAIVGGTDGLRAVSADGARVKVLVPSPVAWVLVDNRGHAVWFGGGDAAQIQVLDLESPAGAPTIRTVVRGLPTETDAGAPLVTISYPDEESELPTGDEITIGHPIMPHVVVYVADPPSLGAAGGILEMWEQQEVFEAAVREATIVEPALLATLARRGAGRPLSAPRPGVEHRVELADYSSCDDADYCGRAEELTPTLWRVVTSFACGDGCYTGWQLYDPVARKLLDHAWSGATGGSWLAPDASAFVVNGKVVRVDTGPVAATGPLDDGDGGLGGGWFGAATYLP
jgi:hypothetical protein